MNDYKLDMAKMSDRVAGVVTDNVNGIAFLMKKNKIDVYHGWGSFKDAHTINVKLDEGSEEELQAEKIIIATGSEVAPLQGVEVDGTRIITSDEAV